MAKPNAKIIPKVARFSDFITCIENYPISRRDYIDILLLCENYIRVHFPDQNDYKYRLPDEYFECNEAIDWVKDPEMWWYVRSAYYTYLQIIKQGSSLKFSTIFEVHKQIINKARYQIDIDCYDDKVLKASCYDDLLTKDHQTEKPYKWLWNPSWRAFLVSAFNIGIDEVNDPYYRTRFKRFIKNLLLRFDKKKLSHQAEMILQSVQDINSSKYRDKKLDCYLVNNQIFRNQIRYLTQEIRLHLGDESSNICTFPGKPNLDYEYHQKKSYDFRVLSNEYGNKNSKCNDREYFEKHEYFNEYEKLLIQHKYLIFKADQSHPLYRVFKEDHELIMTHLKKSDHFAENYNEVGWYFDDIKITKRIRTDAMIYKAYLKYSGNKKMRFVKVDEYEIPINILEPNLEKSPVIKYLDSRISETVYDALMNIKSLVRAHPDSFDSWGGMDEYDIYNVLRGISDSQERLAKEPLPPEKGQRPSDLVACLFGNYGITRQEYIDIVRLHLFNCYLAGFKQEDIFQSTGTLQVMLDDIPGLLRLVPEGFPSNMIYQANKTYESITRWVELNWATEDKFDSPTSLLMVIYQSSILHEEFIGTHCFNDHMYTEGIDEKLKYDLKNYHYNNMLDDISLSMQWKHFFVYVMDYRIEQVYNDDYQIHFVDLIKMIRSIMQNEFPDVINCLATNIEAVNINPRCNNISDELCMQRIYISSLINHFFDVFSMKKFRYDKFDFMMEWSDKEKYIPYSNEEFDIQENDLNDLKFKEIIQTRAKAMYGFEDEVVYSDTIDSLLKGQEGRYAYIHKFYQLIHKDHDEDSNGIDERI